MTNYTQKQIAGRRSRDSYPLISDDSTRILSSGNTIANSENRCSSQTRIDVLTMLVDSSHDPTNEWNMDTQPVEDDIWGDLFASAGFNLQDGVFSA